MGKFFFILSFISVDEILDNGTLATIILDFISFEILSISNFGRGATII